LGYFLLPAGAILVVSPLKTGYKREADGFLLFFFAGS
jgi:hypothetical protein